MTTSRNSRASFSSSSGALLAVPYSLTYGESKNLDLATTPQATGAYTVADPPYLSIQLKSSEWLQRYGLKSQKLTFDQILQQIGFKRVESYDSSIGKSVDSKYAGSLYQEIQHDNGDRYVLTCRPEKLREYRQRLVRMLNLLQKRLTFLTSGSRRVFGVIGEPSVCLVCDCKTKDHQIYNQFQVAIRNLMKEQISKIKRFNIIWISNDIEQFQGQPVDVTSTSIDEAIDWICNRKPIRNKVSISSTCEAILKAFTNSVHSIYLISEGNSSDSAREILRDNIVKTRLSSPTPIPIHVISLFPQNNDTEVFLRSIAQTADGSYFSYKIKSEIIDYKAPSNLTDPTQIKLQPNKLQYGTNALIPNLEQPIDISLMYKEIFQCQNAIDRLEKILGFVRDEKQNPTQTSKSIDTSNGNPNNNLQRSLVIQSSALFNNDENDMASIDWLKIYGINAQKLDFYSAIQSAAFKHCDGIVTLFKPPENTNGKTNSLSAYPKDKLINAKYCDQFAHVTWPDGTIRHVYVTSEMHRDYERRMRALLEKIKARLLWLKKGSRDVFGTILEKNIYILIDTSKSMENHLSFVKDKLRLLTQDQLFGKERINMVSFNSIINPWRDRLTKVNDTLTQTQLQPWIDGLIAEGSTNTLSAIRFALADSATEGIYLLTDGRPDQNERHILSQVQYRQTIPIHTIAFNCQDQTANQFLFDLSKQTGGRFHAFNYGLDNASIDIPESEDISYLKQEIIRGEKELQRVADLRDECMGRAWSKDNAQTSQLDILPTSLPVRSHSIVNIPSRPNSSLMPQKPDQRKRSSKSLNYKRKIKSGTKSFEETNVFRFTSDHWVLKETEDYLKTSEIKRNHIPDISKEDEDEEEEEVTPKQSRKKLLTPYDEVKSYLKKNSLVSKGLTIFDVLYPTSVTVKEPRHVQVIDRYVLSKVWDDILPFAYGSYANKFRLVNHYAVDLENYEMKLKNLIKDYYEFTSEFIWKCLNEDDKRKLAPHIYWIKLSEENKTEYAQEITREEHVNQSALESFVWRKLSNEEQNRFIEHPVEYHEKTEVVLKNALKDAKLDSVLEGVARMDVEIKRAIKFLQISTDLRQYQKRAQNESKPNVEPTPTIKRKTSANRTFGQRVLCRYDGDGYYYPGTIQKNSDNQLIILFDMEIEQEFIAHAILPMNKSNYNLSLFLNDRVLVRLIRDTEEYWAPGSVLCLPSPLNIPANFYTVHVFDPFQRKVYVHRKDLIRITTALFLRSVCYLQNINREYVINGHINFPVGPSSPPPSPSIPSELMDSLCKKVDKLSQSFEKRFSELQLTLQDQMRAIIILQEQPIKPPIKRHSTQTVIMTPPAPSPIEPKTPPKSRTPSPEPLPSRRSIESGTEVYAVWFDDDGLIYESTIIESHGSQLYTIERTDLPSVQCKISRDDIFLDSDRRQLKDVDAKSCALIKYPKDSRQCYCPAVVDEHLLDKPKTKVRFYDCLEKELKNDQYIIPINEKQFERYIENRIRKEKSLCGQVTVGLNNKTKTFMLGTIIKRLNTGHNYLIEWCDGTKTEQNDEHLFGAFTRPIKHEKGNYVLAIDDNDKLYKPAKIVSISRDKDTLTVQYTDLNNNDDEDSSPRNADVPATTTFFITPLYHKLITRTLQE